MAQSAKRPENTAYFVSWGRTKIHQLAKVDPGRAEAFEFDLDGQSQPHTCSRSFGGDDRDIDGFVFNLWKG